jgi:integrase/recombinase XerC
LKLNHLRAWVGFLSVDYAKTSIHRKVSSVKSLLKFAVRQGAIVKNPAKNLVLPKKAKPLPVFVPETQMLQLMDEVNWDGDFKQARNQLILELLYGCGLRRTELCQIQYNQIDYTQQLIRIIGKGKKERYVPFGNKVLQAMKNYEKICHEKGMNFKQNYLITEQSKPIYGQLVYRIVRESLVKSLYLQKNSPHVLRHTFATHLLDRGAELNAVKEFLGHSSLASTQVYTHNTLSRLKSVHKLAHPKS